MSLEHFSVSKWLIFLLGVCLLSACGLRSQAELQEWMDTEKKAAHANIKPIAEPKRFVAETYRLDGLTEPFSVQKLLQVFKKELTQINANTALIAPELRRPKQPLESVPLDAMTMVGALGKDGKSYAALVKIENRLHTVQLGQYLGQNYGKVMKISDSDLHLREIIQDATGDWVERPTILTVQTAAQAARTK